MSFFLTQLAAFPPANNIGLFTSLFSDVTAVRFHNVGTDPTPSKIASLGLNPSHILLLKTFRRLVNGLQGITWRSSFGLDNPEEPEGTSMLNPHCTCGSRMCFLIIGSQEWQDHPADLNLALTPDLCVLSFGILSCRTR
jgi:hypothetical protein